MKPRPRASILKVSIVRDGGAICLALESAGETELHELSVAEASQLLGALSREVVRDAGESVVRRLLYGTTDPLLSGLGSIGRRRK
jgi:hypothetical protein